MIRSRSHSFRAGFTLVEMLVAIAVLAIILVTASKILSTTATLTTSSNKHMDANDQARAVFDRMADDFARIVRRNDVDYIFWKTSGNDAMYFYTEGASYFDSSTYTVPNANATIGSEKNPVSLVGYRVNNTPTSPDYNQLERLGKALSWDGGAYNASPLPAGYNSIQPNFVAFLTYPPAGFDLSGTVPPSGVTPVTDPAGVSYSNAYFFTTLAGAYGNSGSTVGGLPSAVGTYPSGTPLTTVFNDSTDTSYRSIGSQVFRFEYSFQLKDGTLSAIPVMAYTGSGGKPGTNGVAFSFLTASSQHPLPIDDSMNDNSDGTFAVGSRWYDTQNQIGYICLDATPYYAVWHEIGIQDISAIIVTIAVIDRQGLLWAQNKSTASNSVLANAAAWLPDYSATTAVAITGTVTGDPAYLLNPKATTGWAYTLLPGNSSSMATKMTPTPRLPQAMVSQIRLYQRYFYLNSY
jgi:prepilin-type N-terminal cleavage/methylation domain-containing protein